MVKKLLSLCLSRNQQNGGVDFQRMGLPLSPITLQKKKKSPVFHAERAHSPSVSLYPTEERVVQVINMSAW